MTKKRDVDGIILNKKKKGATREEELRNARGRKGEENKRKGSGHQEKEGKKESCVDRSDME